MSNPDTTLTPPMTGEDGKPRTQFDYLLNAADAAERIEPWRHDYRAKRLALFAYVRALESRSPSLPPAHDRVAKLIADVCDLSPDDPSHPDTICVKVDALRIIAERYLFSECACNTAVDCVGGDELVDGVRCRQESQVPSLPPTDATDAERAKVYAEMLHELIRPDNGQCNQCGAQWHYRSTGEWSYLDGEHYPHCIGRRTIQRHLDGGRVLPPHRSGGCYKAVEASNDSDMPRGVIAHD